MKLTNPKEVEKLNTVTYIVSSMNIDQRIIQEFHRFSEKVGKNHGGVIIAPSDENYSEYLKKLTACPPPRKEELPAILYEDRQLKRCIFNIKLFEDKDILKILTYINEHVRTYNSLSLSKEFGNYQDFQRNKSYFEKLINYILSTPH